MDEMAHEDVTLPAEREHASPLSPKRPRMNLTMTNNHSGERNSDFSQLCAFLKTPGSQSSENTPQKNVVLIGSAESGDAQHEKQHDQLQHTELVIPCFSKVTASHIDNAHKGLSKEFFSTAESHLPHVGKDEQPPFTETDKLSPSLRDDAGGALAESHPSKGTGADTSSHPDCKRLGKSLEDEPHGGLSLPAGNDKDGRQVQSSVSQIQVFNLGSSDEEVRCHSDCTYEDGSYVAGVQNTWSQSAEAEASNQKNNKRKFSENIPFSMEEGYSPNYADSNSFDSNPEEDPSGNLVESAKNKGKISEVQISKNENVAFCDSERKGYIDGMSKNVISPVAECAEGSTVSRDVVLDRNITAEIVRVEIDLCGVNREHAAGKLIPIASSEVADHTTETPLPARISKEPTEGDNDPGSLSVIDPAIWRETDGEAEEKLCNSESTSTVERSPSEKVCKMETQEISTHEQTLQFIHLSATEQFKEKNIGLSYKEPKSCSSPVTKTHIVTGIESDCDWRSDPSKSPHRTAKLPDCFPAGLNHLKTQHTEYLQSGIARMDRPTEFNERDNMISFVVQIIDDEYCNLEKTLKSGQQGEKHKINTCKISAGDCISDWTKGDICECDYRLTFLEEKEKSEEKKKEVVVGEASGQRNLEISVETMQQQSEGMRDTTEASHVECVECESTEANVSTSSAMLSHASQRDQEKKSIFFPDCQNVAEAFMVESKDDPVVPALAPVSDAVVPCQHDLSHSQNSANNPTALNCNDRISPLPSVFTFYDCKPRGFDTFKKIRLSPDDDDDHDDGLENSPLLTGLHNQLLKTSEHQLSYTVPEAASNKQEEIAGKDDGVKEEVAKRGCHTDNMGHDLLSSDSASNELPNFSSEEDIITENQPDCDSACDSYEQIQDEPKPQSASSHVSSDSDSPFDVNASPDVQMKKQFDTVLKELNLFFHIGRHDFASEGNASTTGLCSNTAEVLESTVLNCEEQLSSPELYQHRYASSDVADEDCGSDPVVSCDTGSIDGEQEVPVGSHMCQEAPVYNGEKHRESQEMEKRKKMWSPSFMFPGFSDQLSRRPPEQSRRLEPLRTCTRPIRVGLSKRAKTKHLHRLHPYKATSEMHSN